MDTSNFWWQAAGVDPGPGPGPIDPGDPIGQSLRFRGAQKLTGSTVSSSVFTVSYWAKIGGPMSVTSGGDYYHWAAGAGSSDTGTMIYVNYNTNTSTTGQFRLEAANNDPASVGRFRDVAAWYHVVVNRDGTNATMWVNGEQQIAPVAASALSNQFLIGNGHDGGAGTHFKGYMADWYFIDGQALEPTAFGRYNSNGVWVPVDYSGSFGSNGFHLNFADPSNLGKDVANGNDFTATGFDTSPPGTWSDKCFTSPNAPTPDLASTAKNFDPGSPIAQGFDGSDATWARPADAGEWTILRLNTPIVNVTSLRVLSGNIEDIWLNGSTIWPQVVPDPAANTEYNCDAAVSGGVDVTSIAVKCGSLGTNSWRTITVNGQILVDSTGTDYDVMQDSPTQNFATINPLYPGASTSKANLTTANATGKPTILGIAGDVGVDGASVAWDGTEAGWTSTGAINFGQQPGGFDEFSTRTMPAATIANGRDHFQAITGPGADILTAAQNTFPNGLWWIKDRVNSNSWQLACSQYDIAPTDNVIISNAVNYQPYTAPAGSSVAFCWDLTDPAKSGCEFISTIGNETRGTVDHHLGRVPGMIWAFNVGAASVNQIYVYHQSLGPTKSLSLPETGIYDRDIFWGNDPSQFTTTTFGVGPDASTNPNGPVYYWLWAEIPGYSAFGSYTGNGNADGPFVNLAFRPAFLMIKCSTAGTGGVHNWYMHDTTRAVSNPSNNPLAADVTQGEFNFGSALIDILSNGFKLRGGPDQMNGNQTYIYAAFAENPFQSPATAR